MGANHMIVLALAALFDWCGVDDHDVPLDGVLLHR